MAPSVASSANIAPAPDLAHQPISIAYDTMTVEDENR